jgi:hypothetical protein
MVVTTTGIGFSLLALGLAFCGLRFFRAFQKLGDARKGSIIGMLLSTMFLNNALTLGILAAGAFFFSQNSEVLYTLLLLSHFPLGLAAALSAYLAVYINFPSVSPWPATVAASMLGIAVIILTIITHPLPFTNVSGGIEWNMSRLLAMVLSYLTFIPMGAELVIFIPSFLRARSREVKTVSLVIVTLALIGILNMSARFLLPYSVHDSLRTRIFDGMFTVMGLAFISVFLLPPVVVKWISGRLSE